MRTISPQDRDARPSGARQRAIVREALGLGQVLASIIALLTVARDGLSARAAAATLVACLLMAANILLSRESGRSGSKPER